MKKFVRMFIVPVLVVFCGLVLAACSVEAAAAPSIPTWTPSDPVDPDDVGGAGGAEDTEGSGGSVNPEDQDDPLSLEPVYLAAPCVSIYGQDGGTIIYTWGKVEGAGGYKVAFLAAGKEFDETVMFVGDDIDGVVLFENLTHVFLAVSGLAVGEISGSVWAVSTDYAAFYDSDAAEFPVAVITVAGFDVEAELVGNWFLFGAGFSQWWLIKEDGTFEILYDFGAVVVESGEHGVWSVDGDVLLLIYLDLRGETVGTWSREFEFVEGDLKILGFNNICNAGHGDAHDSAGECFYSDEILEKLPAPVVSN